VPISATVQRVEHPRPGFVNGEIGEFPRRASGLTCSGGRTCSATARTATCCSTGGLSSGSGRLRLPMAIWACPSSPWVQRASRTHQPCRSFRFTIPSPKRALAVVVLRAAPPEGLRRVRAPGRRERLTGRRSTAGPASGPRDVQGEPDSLQPNRPLRRIGPAGDRSVQGRARPQPRPGDRPAHPGAGHRSGVWPAGGFTPLNDLILRISEARGGNDVPPAHFHPQSPGVLTRRGLLG
jgi:hypothetical protein